MPVRPRRREPPLIALVLALSAALAAGAVSPAHSRPASDDPSGSGGRRAATRAALDAVTAAGAPGVSAEAVDENGGWYGTSGVADLATGRARLPQDRFRAGSVTKTFTAVVLLQLEAEHRLALDDTVGKWLPGVVRGHGNDGRRISLRQLLNHTSGLFDYVEDEGVADRLRGTPSLAHRFDTYTAEQLVRIAVGHRPRFAPGMGWGYSNTNYVLAGMVIAKVTGRPYEEEVRRRITAPLGLRATTLPGASAEIPGPHGRAYSRLRLPGPHARVYDVTELNPSVTGGAAGELVTTSGDLNRFYGALLGGRLLAGRQMEEMLAGVPMGRGRTVSGAYGLGISSRRLSCGVTVWGHDGAIQGSLTWVFGTRDGSRLLSLNINADWVPQGRLSLGVAEAEFCGRAPAAARGLGSWFRWTPAG